MNRPGGNWPGVIRFVAAVTVAVSVTLGVGVMFLWWAFPRTGGRPASEGNRMDTTHPGAKPDETDSSAVGRPPAGQGQAPVRPEVTKSAEGESEATASHRPARVAPAGPEKEDDELILEREPDGRYRIVGRRPRPQPPPDVK